MNRTNTLIAPRTVAAVCMCLFAGSVAAPAQTPQEPAGAPRTPTPQVGATPIKTKRFTVGIRGRILPVKSLSVMGNNTLLDTISVPAPARDYNYVTTTRSPKWGGGVSVDYEFSPKWIVTVDGLFNK